MGGLEKQRKAFRILFVAKYKFSGICEVERKLMPSYVQQTNQIDHFGTIGSDFLDCSVLETNDLLMNFDWPQISPQIKQIKKLGPRRRPPPTGRDREPRPRRGEGGGKPPPWLRGLGG